MENKNANETRGIIDSFGRLYQTMAKKPSKDCKAEEAECLKNLDRLLELVGEDGGFDEAEALSQCGESQTVKRIATSLLFQAAELYNLSQCPAEDLNSDLEEGEEPVRPEDLKLEFEFLMDSVSGILMTASLGGYWAEKAKEA